MSDEPKIFDEKYYVQFADQNYIYVTKESGASDLPEYYTILSKSGDVVFENGVPSLHEKRYAKSAYILEDEHIKIFIIKEGGKYLYRRVKFNRNMTIDKGYGEKEDIYVTSLQLDLYNQVSWLDFYRVYFNRIYDVPYYYYANGETFIRNDITANKSEWYNGTILFFKEGKNVVYDKDFKEITRFDSRGDLYPYEKIYYLSYEDALTIGSCTLRLYKSGKYQHITKLDDFAADYSTKYIYTLLNQEKDSMTFHVKAVNFDGSKMEFDFKVELETLEITYL